MKNKRVGIVTNVWGWRSWRGIGWWLSLWSFPWSVHGVEVTRDYSLIFRDGWQAPFRVFDRILKIGPFWMRWGRVTKPQDGTNTYYDATATRVVRYPYGRLTRWRTQRRLAQIERDNARRATDKAMREGWS